MKVAHIQTKEAQRSSNKINPRRSKPRARVLKWQNVVMREF